MNQIKMMMIRKKKRRNNRVPRHCCAAASRVSSRPTQLVARRESPPSYTSVHIHSSKSRMTFPASDRTEHSLPCTRSPRKRCFFFGWASFPNLPRQRHGHCRYPRRITMQRHICWPNQNKEDYKMIRFIPYISRDASRI